MFECLSLNKVNGNHFDAIDKLWCLLGLNCNKL